MLQDDNHSEANQSQVAAKNLTAGGDIRIDSIVQTIVNLGLPFNSQYLRFVQFLANSAYLTCLIWGFIRLWQNGADFTTLMMIIVGSGLLLLTCLYYAWFWKPEIQDRSPLIPEGSLDNEQVERQRTKQRSRQQIRRLAIAGFFLIPLLTCAGFFGWRSMPPPKVLALVADFAGPSEKPFSEENVHVGIKFREKLKEAIKKDPEVYSDVKVESLGKTITAQQDSEVARGEGEKKKATIVIWGWYGVPKDFTVNVRFELLRSPTYFPKQTDESTGDIQSLTDNQTLATAKLNSFELPTDLNRTSYFTLFTTGMVRYAAGDWDKAIKRFNDALAQIKPETSIPDLNQGVVYFYRGVCFYNESNYSKAIADYTQALNLKPDFVEALTNRGNAYVNQGDLTQAVLDYNEALKLNPNLVEAYNGRGAAYIDQGNFTKAIADFNQTLTLKPNYVEAYNNRGNAYLMQDKFVEAIADYNKALEINPGIAEVYTGRGTAYRNQGNSAQAISDFNQAVKLNPGLAEAYANRGGAYRNQGNFTQAITDSNQAIKLKPKYAGAYMGRGIAYADQGNSAQAIADLNQAIKLKPKYAEAYYNRGSVYTTQGNSTKAIADFNQAIKLKPDYAEAYHNRGKAYYDQGDSTKAIADFSQALKLRPNDAEDYTSRGVAYDEQGNYTQAVADHNQAIKLNPKYVEAYNNRGVTYGNQGKYTEAIADFTQALKLNPKYAGAYYNKAWIYSLKKEVKAAIENLQRAINLDAKLREIAKTDSDFDNIRKDKQFQALVGK
jgi:tetratricopeptide (TPR) repeat protein